MKKHLFIGALILSTMFISNSSNAQVAKFQSLYMYNICRYVEWPASFGGSNFEIGIVGNNADLTKELQAIASSKKILNKKIVVKQVKSAGESTSCHVLFFTKGSDKRIGEFGAAKNALIMTEASGALNKGSAINFFLDGSKLKFDLKKANAEKKGLKISNDLENLAAKSY